jgi:hypothetical protein
MKVTREEAQDMAEAHAQGYHHELPREGCPECEDRPLREYPRAADIATAFRAVEANERRSEEAE